MKNSIVATGAAIGTSLLSKANAAEPTSDSAREYYELRKYHLRRGPMQKRFDDFYRNAAIPAFNKAGISTVGVFNVAVGPESPTMYVVLPHKSLESFATLGEKLRSNPDYINSEFVNASPTEPGYLSAESSLMMAFESLPKLEVPKADGDKKPKIYELRTYESHSKRANKKKIEMFNKGEIELFRRTGLTPVFFGETLIGTQLPNLTYLLAFENMAEREKNWATFIADPEWKKMSSTPGYTDVEIVTSISNVFLRPTAYSQI